MTIRAALLAGLALLLSGTTLHAVTPTVIVSAQKGTIAVAASPTQLLFTQPFCDNVVGNPARGVYSVNTTTKAVTLYSALPSIGGCAENYIAIATSIVSSAGFPTGIVYATSGPHLYVIPPGGGAATLVTITGTALTGPDTHSSVGFDLVGSFGHNLFFTSTDGVWVLSFVNATTLNATKLSSGVDGGEVFIESPAVSPSNGSLYVVAEDDNANFGSGPLSGIYTLAPGGASLVPFKHLSGAAPEAIQFLPANLQNLCTLTVSGTSYAGFLSVFTLTNGAPANPGDSEIVGYPAAAFAGDAGKAVVSFEYSPTNANNPTPPYDDVQIMDPTTGAFTSLGDVPAQLEGFNLLTCPTTVCPLTQGYWKNHSDKWPVTSLTIGGKTYTESQLLTVLKTAPKGGDAVLILAHQLIAAMLNVANGAATPGTLITQGNALLTGINLTSFTSVKASSTLGAEMVSVAGELDTYNQTCDSDSGDF